MLLSWEAFRHAFCESKALLCGMAKLAVCWPHFHNLLQWEERKVLYYFSIVKRAIVQELQLHSWLVFEKRHTLHKYRNGYPVGVLQKIVYGSWTVGEIFEIIWYGMLYNPSILWQKGNSHHHHMNPFSDDCTTWTSLSVLIYLFVNPGVHRHEGSVSRKVQAMEGPQNFFPRSIQLHCVKQNVLHRIVITAEREEIWNS